LSPEFQPVNRHTCGANSSLCITVVGLSPGIRPVGAGLFPPTWVAGVTPAPRRCPRSHPSRTGDGSMWAETPRGRSTAAPRWSRPPQTKPHAPNPSPQPSHKLVVGREPVTARGRGFLVYFPSFSPLCSRASSRTSTPNVGVLAAASARRGVSQAFRSYRRFFK
jgi:hypothetical protein